MAHSEADRSPFDDDDEDAVNWTCRLEIPERSYAEAIAQAGARREGRLAAELLWAAIVADLAAEARRMRGK